EAVAAHGTIAEAGHLQLLERIVAPAFDHTQVRARTGVVAAGADRIEGAGRRHVVAAVVVAPTFDRAVIVQAAGMLIAGGDRDERSGRSGALPRAVRGPAFH